MTVLNDTNHGRVAKITEIVALLQKSAASNKASQDDLWALMDPVVQAIQTVLDPDRQPSVDQPVAPEAEPVKAPTSTRKDIMLWNEAQSAPLSDLMMAYSTITARLLDLVDETKGKT